MPAFHRPRSLARIALLAGATLLPSAAFAGGEPTTTTTLVKPTTTTIVKPSTTTTTKATTTSTKPSTTTTSITIESTTTLASTTTTIATTTTTQVTETTTTQSVTTTTRPTEICGNCADDDGDGLTDFEDPDCCSVSTTLTVRKASVRYDGVGTRFLVRGCIALDDHSLVNPFEQDFYMQVRDTKTGTVLCSNVAAEHFMRLHSHTVAFWDRSGKITSANGIEDVAVTDNKKCLGFYAFGRHVQFDAEQGARYQVTTAFQKPSDPNNAVCAQTPQALETGKPLRRSRNR